MELIKIEKFLDSATSSCDESSTVHDCYFYLSTNMYSYFNEYANGPLEFIDVETNQIFTFQLNKGREWRLTLFNQYITAKNINMGDKVIISIVKSHNNLALYIDVEHTNFFKKDPSEANKYFGYLTQTFLDLFLTDLEVTLSMTDGGSLTIRKEESKYNIADTNLTKFILVENDGLYHIQNLSNPTAETIAAIVLEANVEEISESDLSTDNTSITIDLSSVGRSNFEYKNILLKGVPGTGKSFLIDNTLIQNKLGLTKGSQNILRINVHSASSNADLMQGIGINTTPNYDIEYKEKQGLILNHIREAILHPKQTFALVLEEIQENSLNELIGDLIYLIEPDKRTNVADYVLEAGRIKADYNDLTSLEALIDKIIATPITAEDDGSILHAHYVEIPNLVSAETKKRKMIFPDNLYVFCTSNFRDDKKVIEDNLLRRFDTIEIYPNYRNTLYANSGVANFLSKFNDTILERMENDEVHPDRFLIGHAIWQKVNNAESFYRALLKVVVEFKDVKELEFKDYLKGILSKADLVYPFEIDRTLITGFQTYKQLIEFLQEQSYNFLTEQVAEGTPPEVATEETDGDTVGTTEE